MPAEEVAAPALGQMEFVRGEALGEVPVEHRRLNGDGEKGREIEVRRAKQRAGRLVDEEEDGDAEADENAVIFGEDREAQNCGRGVEPKPIAAACFPFL